MCGSPRRVLCPPSCTHWMFLCLFPARLHPCTSPGCWRLLPLPLMCCLPQLLWDPVPGQVPGVAQWLQLTLSQWVNWVTVAWQVSPTETVWGEQTWICRSLSRSAPTSVRGAEADRAARMYLQLFAFTYPMVAGTGCFPRAVLPPGPALGHTKITCICFLSPPCTPNGPA